MERKSHIRKQELIDSFKEKYSKGNQYVMFFDFSGIDAYPLTQLRLEIRELDGEIVVGKNTLFYRAFSETPLVDHREIFVGPTAAVFAYGDVVEVTKKIVDFLKDNFDKEYSQKLKGGLLQNKYMTPEDIRSLAELPSREELIAKLIGLLNAPMTQLVMSLKAVPQKLAMVVKAIEEQKS
jgi:large subunit ribosomal protein L10